MKCAAFLVSLRIPKSAAKPVPFYALRMREHNWHSPTSPNKACVGRREESDCPMEWAATYALVKAHRFKSSAPGLALEPNWHLPAQSERQPDQIPHSILGNFQYSYPLIAPQTPSAEAALHDCCSHAYQARKDSAALRASAPQCKSAMPSRLLQAACVECPELAQHGIMS